jgi:hypothetical protein
MARPPLDAHLDPQVFEAWYWQKTELAAFCRAQGLPASGDKAALTARVLARLTKQAPLLSKPPRRSSAAMPDTLTPQTVIGPGWRFTQALRDYFELHHGKGFHFNQALREFIRTQMGSTLAQALTHYQSSLDQPKAAIAKQFQYNQHIRDYFAKHPGAKREQAIAAWWAWREQASERS